MDFVNPNATRLLAEAKNCTITYNLRGILIKLEFETQDCFIHCHYDVSPMSVTVLF